MRHRTQKIKAYYLVIKGFAKGFLWRKKLKMKESERPHTQEFNMNKKLVVLLTALFFTIIVISVASAQVPPTLPGAPDQAPIDGGLSLLALGGGFYALKKLKKK